MVIYLDIVMFVNFLVDYLLLMGANALARCPLSPGRTALGAGVGGLYAGLCLLPGFAFLGNFLWRAVALCLMAMTAYGFSLSRSALFVVVSLALGGVAQGLSRDFFSLAGAAGGLCLLCVLGFYQVGRQYLPVELSYGDRHLCLTALRDTGNTLCDPVSGNPVLVVDGEVAEKLTGLTKAQLENPVEHIGALPGLRLIPYRAVGTEAGMLLAMRLGSVKIGAWRGSYVVAFAPGTIGGSGKYQALTGGMV